MKKEILISKRGTPLRKNGSNTLEVLINSIDYKNIFLINGSSFITKDITKFDLIIKPQEFYMVINNGKKDVGITYSEDVSKHEILYHPYKYEQSEKKKLNAEKFKEIYNLPEDYVDTLPKWYSFKFTYPDYNLIFIRPELGISIQSHDQRKEYWEVLEGTPIIINANKVHYFVESGTKFETPINAFHSVINPNIDKFVILKERWSGYFDEEDIRRVFNPNNYK